MNNNRILFSTLSVVRALAFVLFFFTLENPANSQALEQANRVIAAADAMQSVDEPDWAGIVNRYKEALALVPRDARLGEREYVQALVDWAAKYAAAPWLWCNRFDMCERLGDRADVSIKYRLAFDYYITAWSRGYRPFSKPVPPFSRMTVPAGPLASALVPFRFVDDFYSNLKATPQERALLPKILAVSRRVQPIPEPTQAARDSLSRAATALKAANNSDEAQRQLDHFFSAIRLSPWWADPYLALGTTAQGVGGCGISREALNLYLRAEPNSRYAPQARQTLAKCPGR